MPDRAEAVQVSNAKVRIKELKPEQERVIPVYAAIWLWKVVLFCNATTHQ